MIAPKKITLTIDGRRCEGQEGQTILQVAQANGINIPTLCYLKHLSPWGGCRMCIVEIVGSPKVVPACSTPAMDGKEIVTNSESLQKLRRSTLELLFSERNHICPFCVMNKGDCELQHQGYLHGIDAISLPYLYPAWPVDVSGKYFALDHNRCILCTRCVRTCEEMEGTHTLDISNRGANNRVVVDLGATFGTSDTCTNCGACVAACPTGALFDKAAAFRGKLAPARPSAPPAPNVPSAAACWFTRRKTASSKSSAISIRPSARATCACAAVTRPGPNRASASCSRWSAATENWSRPPGRKRSTPCAQAAKKAKPDQKAVLVSPRLTNETVATLEEIRARRDVRRRKRSRLVRQQRPHARTRMAKLHDADAIIVLGAQPSRAQGVVAAKIRTTVRLRKAKLLIFHTRKSDLDQYADHLRQRRQPGTQILGPGGRSVAGRETAGAGLRAGRHDAHRRGRAGTADQDF